MKRVLKACLAVLLIPCLVLMNTGTRVAEAGPLDRTVTLQSNPSGAGTLSGDGTYFIATKVTITASPNAGYEFVRWTVAEVPGWSESDPTYTTQPLVQDRTFTAHFRLIPNTPPTISLIGSADINLNVGDSFSDPGATATDAQDGNLTSSIVVSGTVNTAIPDNYTITYTVTDSRGASATVSRTVTVSSVDMAIDGPSSIDIPASGSITESYSADMTSVNGSVSGNVTWAVQGSPAGVSITDSGTLTVDSDANAGNIVVVATCTERSASATKTIELVYVPEPTTLTINGASNITLKYTETKSETYTAEVRDQRGNLLADEEIALSISGNEPGVSFENGTVTVLGTASPSSFIITATSGTLTDTLSVDIVREDTAPVATNVDISGTAAVGETLTGTYTYSDVDPEDADGSIVKWYSGSVVVETGLALEVTSAMKGKAIVFEVTPSNTNGTGTPVSATVQYINSAPAASGASIVGGMLVGDSLSGDYNFSDPDNDRDDSTYQWYRSGKSNGTNLKSIEGATSDSYNVVGNDKGKYLYFEVTPVDEHGLSGPTIISGGRYVYGDINPRLDSIVDNGDGSYTATFGYNNTNSETLNGVSNFTGEVVGEFDAPTSFLPGRNDGVFSVTYTGDKLEWSLTGPNGVTKKVVAAFKPVVTVTATPADGGSVSQKKEGGVYNLGAKVTISAEHNLGYRFVNWTLDGDEFASAQNHEFEISSSVDLVANFEKALSVAIIADNSEARVGDVITYTITVTNNGPDALSAEVISSLVPGGGTVDLSAGASEDITVEYTVPAGTPTGLLANTATATLVECYGVQDTANVTILRPVPAPTFTQVVYNVVTTAGNGGNVSGGGNFLPGEFANLTATAADGYEFVNWTEGGNVVGTDATLDFMVLGNRSLVANFAEIIVEEEVVIVPEDETPLGPITEPVEEPIEEPVKEPVTEPVLDEPVPQAPVTLPKTGELPAILFYGLGTALAALGLSVKKRK